MSVVILADDPLIIQEPFGGSPDNWTPSVERATEGLTRLGFSRLDAILAEGEAMFGPEPAHSFLRSGSQFDPVFDEPTLARREMEGGEANG